MSRPPTVSTTTGSTSTSSYWAYDQTNASYYSWSHANGKLYHFSRTTSSLDGATVNPLTQASSVSVLPGATLKVRGAPLALSKFKVDMTGTGRLQNVAFASAGTLFVTAETGETDLFFPVDFGETTDSGNIANWSVNVNGVTRRGWAADVVAGGMWEGLTLPPYTIARLRQFFGERPVSRRKVFVK